MQIGALLAECVCNLLRINTHSHEHGKVGEYFTSYLLLQEDNVSDQLKIDSNFQIDYFTCHKFRYRLRIQQLKVLYIFDINLIHLVQ